MSGLEEVRRLKWRDHLSKAALQKRLSSGLGESAQNPLLGQPSKQSKTTDQRHPNNPGDHFTKLSSKIAQAKEQGLLRFSETGNRVGSFAKKKKANSQKPHLIKPQQENLTGFFRKNFAAGDLV